MNIDRWLYKISKIMKKCTRHVKANDYRYYAYGHQMAKSRASMIATNKGLGRALLIAPPVLVLIAAGIAASSKMRAPPIDNKPPDISTHAPPVSTTSTKNIISGIQAQLQSITTVDDGQDHATIVATAVVAIGVIGVALVVRAIRRRRRGGGGGGNNAADGNYEYPGGKNNTYCEVQVQTSSPLHAENPALNVGSGGDPFQSP